MPAPYLVYPFTASVYDRDGTALQGALIEIEDYDTHVAVGGWLDPEQAEEITDLATMLTDIDGLFVCWLLPGLYRWRSVLDEVTSQWEPVHILPTGTQLIYAWSDPTEFEASTPIPGNYFPLPEPYGTSWVFADAGFYVMTVHYEVGLYDANNSFSAGIVPYLEEMNLPPTEVNLRLSYPEEVGFNKAMFYYNMIIIAAGEEVVLKCFGDFEDPRFRNINLRILRVM